LELPYSTIDEVISGVRVDLVVVVQDQIQFGVEVLELLHDGGGGSHGCPKNRIDLRIPV
jgi:hypothetical protein